MAKSSKQGLTSISSNHCEICLKGYKKFFRSSYKCLNCDRNICRSCSKKIKHKIRVCHPCTNYMTIKKKSQSQLDSFSTNNILKESKFLHYSANASHKPISIPYNLISRFEDIAKPNTLMKPRGIETCGILAGKNINGEFLITHLIIPFQKGYKDQCIMTNEEELLTYYSYYELLTIGWIHTHPSQSCCLSSVDLHTHCGFQMMLPESIAIVVAPKDTGLRVGIFRLTQAGMSCVQECSSSGFHMHGEAPECLYNHASGYVYNKNLHTNIIDLRN